MTPPPLSFLTANRLFQNIYSLVTRFKLMVQDLLGSVAKWQVGIYQDYGVVKHHRTMNTEALPKQSTSITNGTAEIVPSRPVLAEISTFVYN